MRDFLASSLLLLLFVSAAVAIVLGSYVAARKLLNPGVEGDRTHDVASSIAFRIGALHGLILALVYAQELDDYKNVRTILTEEAVAISDVFNDVVRYRGPVTHEVQSDLVSYLSTVVNEEWDQLGARKGLSPKAWNLWQDAYDRLLDLEPQNQRQQYLRTRMLDRITTIARFRQERETASLRGFSSLFWAPAIIGLALLAMPFYVYRPMRSHLILLGFFGAYAGVVLFFIFAFSNPFAQPGRLDPAPFEQLLTGDIGKLVPQ